MSGRAKVSAAKEQGLKVVSDQELWQLTEGRVRQLEQELVGHRVLLEEMEADPHIEEDPEDPQNPVTHTRATIESLETRLEKVLHPRLDALRANIKTDQKAQVEPTP